MTPQILEKLRLPASGVRSVLIIGHAGSGKSTLLKRLAYQLSSDGYSCFFFRSPTLFSEGGLLVETIALFRGKQVQDVIQPATRVDLARPP